MTFDIKHEKGNYLNPAQKQLKQTIMEALMKDLFGKINKNIQKLSLDWQATADIVISCLIMFSREVILNIIEQSILPNDLDVREKFIDGIQHAIKVEILSRLKLH